MDWLRFLEIVLPSFACLNAGYLYGRDAGRRSRDERPNTDA